MNKEEWKEKWVKQYGTEPTFTQYQVASEAGLFTDESNKSANEQDSSTASASQSTTDTPVQVNSLNQNNTANSQAQSSLPSASAMPTSNNNYQQQMYLAQSANYGYPKAHKPVSTAALRILAWVSCACTILVSLIVTIFIVSKFIAIPNVAYIDKIVGDGTFSTIITVPFLILIFVIVPNAITKAYTVLVDADKADNIESIRREVDEQ